MMEHGFVRVVKETGLRSVGSHLVGSNPTARIAVEGSIPSCGKITIDNV